MREKISGIYILYDEECIVYVGKGIDIITRLNQHIKFGKEFIDVFIIEMDREIIRCRDSKYTIEGDLIRLHKPIYNIMLNPNKYINRV